MIVAGPRLLASMSKTKLESCCYSNQYYYITTTNYYHYYYCCIHCYNAALATITTNTRPQTPTPVPDHRRIAQFGGDMFSS